MPTLDHWHSHGGLVGRGVLIDYRAYSDALGSNDSHPFDGHRITIEEIEAIAAYQHVEFKQGDIFILRTGLTEVHENPTAEDLEKMRDSKITGIHGSVQTAEWFWNNHFAAAVADNNAFEAYPPLKPDGSIGAQTDLGEWLEMIITCCGENWLTGRRHAVLHEWFLALFGLPIGELWDLKKLAAYCEKTGRYSFMVTSAPLNLPGLVGSPPNALAIF